LVADMGLIGFVRGHGQLAAAIKAAAPVPAPK
jgi:hypothetical protein